jgi:RNase P/RNase MRP subunit p29
MQKRELNPATVGVANRTDISGRVTADETNRSLQLEKRSRQARRPQKTCQMSLHGPVA